MSKLYNSHMTSNRKAIKIFYDVYGATRLRDKDALYEHHDCYVGEYVSGII